LQREKSGGKQTSSKSKQSSPKYLEAGEAVTLSTSYKQNAGEINNSVKTITASRSTNPSTTRCWSTSVTNHNSNTRQSSNAAKEANYLNKPSLTRCQSTSGLLITNHKPNTGQTNITAIAASKPRCQSSSGQRKSLGDFTEIHLGDTSININGSGLQLAIRRHSSTSTKTETSPNADCKATARYGVVIWVHFAV